MNESTAYFNSLNKLNLCEYIKFMEQYAKENDVPIIEREGLSYILHLLKLYKPRHILEIGTAIGYSSINFALLDSGIHITTIERDAKMYEEASKNVENMNLHNQIDILYEDALNINLERFNDLYDVIFIDAAKAQYQKFFEKYTPLLKKGGIVISDNLLFHGLIFEDIEGRNLKGLTKKIRRYNEWLQLNNDYDTHFTPIGDGIAISIKK
ncbi:O-methyltransferase [Haloplasma contractile]|uniref:tRNA 5-hydroxyuridine methyltransferase n=1 Tax=Haloplasma contractile SSD-17B TaxID=1033810 RepID=U2DZV6_9MOLU|nr:O-methyltransferase [Haloplasma contractile]ERJ13717.1 Putative O-methyltransferase YrrM protein [Haloplasma contractile SSD-17B]